MSKRFTPPQLARAWGIDPHKILSWVRSGELVAVNLATRPGGRPRYRISEDAVTAFEARRSAQVQPTAMRQTRRKKADDGVIEFFK